MPDITFCYELLGRYGVAKGPRAGPAVRVASATQITARPTTVRLRIGVFSDGLNKLPLSNTEQH